MKSFTNEEAAAMYELLCEYREKDTVDLRQKVNDLLNNLNKKENDIPIGGIRSLIEDCQNVTSPDFNNKLNKLKNRLNKIFLNFENFVISCQQIIGLKIIIFFKNGERESFTIDEIEKMEKTILD